MDVRKNLQARQPGIEGDDVNDANGWPTPLSDPSNPLKLVVRVGSLGTTKDFRAMSTEGQDKLSLPEGKSEISRDNGESFPLKVKVTELDSLKGD